MYAVVKSGGHQYRVAVGDRLVVDRLVADEGSEVSLGSVLLHKDGESSTCGAPYLHDIEVRGKVVKHSRHPKVIVFKYKRRKNYKRTKGWKQPCSEVEITSIGKASGS